MAQPQPQPAQALSLEEQVDQLEYEIQKLARIIRRPGELREGSRDYLSTAF